MRGMRAGSEGVDWVETCPPAPVPGVKVMGAVSVGPTSTVSEVGCAAISTCALAVAGCNTAIAKRMGRSCRTVVTLSLTLRDIAWNGLSQSDVVAVVLQLGEDGRDAATLVSQIAASSAQS
jgi:hypothetical protein